jgi:putative tryptophan/tyrosine transport system substrate-binding protein
VAEPNPNLEGAFAAIRQEHADTVPIRQEPVVALPSKKIAELAARDRLLTSAGGLTAYGTSVSEALRRPAAHVDTVLKRAKPHINT